MSQARPFTLRPELISGAICLLLAGCSFSPNFPEGTVACDSTKASSCPPGFSCVNGYCRSRVGDGGADRSEGGGSGDAVQDNPVDQVQPGDAGDAPVSDAPEAGGSDSATDNPSVPDASEDSRVDAGYDSLPDTAADAGKDSGADVPVCTVTCSTGDTRCGTNGGLQTCSIVAGCPAWGTEVPCPGAKTCQGAAPSASCLCPTPPASCKGAAGYVCESSSSLAKCTLDSDQCLTITQRTTCPGARTCTGTHPTAACTCPAPPAACAQGAGAYCASSASLTTCAAGGDGCLTASSQACGSGRYCWGSSPSAACNAPLTLGWPDDLRSSGNRTAGFLLGYPIEVTSNSLLRGFGIVARASAGVRAQIGLYLQVDEDVLDLVASVTDVRVQGDTRNEFAVSQPVALEAYNTYWMMVTYETQISVAQDVDPSGTTRKRISFGYGNPLPPTLTGTITEPAARTNYYLLVTPQ